MKEIDNDLIDAAYLGNVSHAKKAIDAGADPNSMYGTPLYLASAYGHIEIVRLLLSRGATQELLNYSAIDIAERNGHREIVKILKEAKK